MCMWMKRFKVWLFFPQYPLYELHWTFFIFYFWLPSGKIKPQKHLKTLHLLCTIDDLISNKLYPQKNSIKYHILVTWCQYFYLHGLCFKLNPSPKKKPKKEKSKKRIENFDPLKCALGALCSPKFSSASSSSSFSSSCPTRTLLGFGV